MLDTKQLEEWLDKGLVCKHLTVEGDGHHFSAVIVSDEFSGLSRVRRQQRINAILKERFDSGELHALSMQTFTADEWQARG